MSQRSFKQFLLLLGAIVGVAATGVTAAPSARPRPRSRGQSRAVAPRQPATSSNSATVTAGVRETTLPNGLKVLTKEVHSAPVVVFQVWYKVGSRNEHTGITGCSHLLEHMMFKGTPRYRVGEIPRTLFLNGAAFN